MKVNLFFRLLPVFASVFLPAGLLAQRDTAIKLPNIILIVADDLGVGDVGSYGQSKIATPNIDALAKSGMRFTQFYAGTSVCAPSRAALMTGLHTGHTAIRGNREITPEGQWPLPQNSITVAEILKQAGYATGDFGKWGLGPVGSSGDPLKQGFDVFFGYNCQRQSHNYYPDHLWDQDQRINYPENKPDKFKDYAPDIIQKKALSFIEVNKQKPFFLYLSYTLPHAALQLPEDSLFDHYKKLFNETPVPVKLPWSGQGYAPQAYPHAAYAAMVSRLDNYIGQIVNDIKLKGLDKNTVIIFTSDNGPHKEGGNDPDFFNSNMGLRGYKRDLYEGGIRAPMIVSWPGKVKPGTKSDHIAAFWDFMPTFAEISNRKPEYTDGISFLPELLSHKQIDHESLYWEFHEAGGRQAIRMDQWKGVRQNIINDPNAPVELYDLKNDPAEKKDLAKKYKDIVKTMRTFMDQQHVENDDFPLLKK